MESLNTDIRGQRIVKILGRYVAVEFLRIFGLTLAAAGGIYLVIDVFERTPGFLKYSPPLSAIVQYFILRLPGIVSDVYPAACLLGILISLGSMTRNHEILALRSCGISTWKLATPLLSLAFMTSIGALAWNEMVVPPAYAYSRYLNDVVIKKKDERGSFNSASLWFQAPEGFYHIDYYSDDDRSIKDLTLFRVGSDFRVKEIVEVPQAQWKDDRWVVPRAWAKKISGDGAMDQRLLEKGEFAFTEPPAELKGRKRLADEFTFTQLRRQIRVLQAKGLDAAEFQVDLHRKLAWPFSGFVTVLIGFPLAVRGGRGGGTARNIAAGLVVGLAYWVVMAIALSAGKTGGLPAPLAAWTANLVFLGLGGMLYLGSDGV